jgi:uncharacterized protein YaeQ
MSFVAAFYNFTVELNNADRDIYTRFRVKTARHPYESLEHLYARMIAYCHSFREGQSFTQGMFEPKEPAIWLKDVIGETLLWIEVGPVDKRKLEITLRSSPQAEHRIYFYSSEHVHSFCHMLKGSKTNWVKDISFFLIPPEFLEQLIPLEHSSPLWTMTCVENRIYLSCDGVDSECDLAPINIWDAYQDYLRSAQVSSSIEPT